jgi:hypothetical protein
VKIKAELQSLHVIVLSAIFVFSLSIRKKFIYKFDFSSKLGKPILYRVLVL